MALLGAAALSLGYASRATAQSHGNHHGRRSAPAAPAPAAAPGFPAQADGQARVVVLNLSWTDRARPLSIWSSRSGYAPWVTNLAYSNAAYVDVAPGPQGYVPRLAGMEVPTVQHLGWNSGAGNLLAGRVYFIVAPQPSPADRAETRIEAASIVAPTDGNAALRIMGAWPVNRTIDVCVRADGAERPVVANLGGRGYFGTPGPRLPNVQNLPAGATELLLHLSTGTACAGAPLGHVNTTLTAGQSYALFLHGEAETSLAGALCRESGAGCEPVTVTR
jgi:hypothetical protein